MSDSEFAIPEEINSTTFDRYQTLLYRSLINISAKRNNELPSKEVPFYRMIDPTAAQKMDQLSGRILPRINQMISTVDLPGSEGFCEITEAEDVDSWSKDFVSLVDSLIDGVNVSLDEFSGRTKKISATINKSKPVVAEISNNKSDLRCLYASTISRPQLNFKEKVDNTSAPFIPKLVEKPNAMIPLDVNVLSYQHPYECEIKNIVYPAFMFEDREPILSKRIVSSPFIWVDTLEELTAMCEKLEDANEIAVDLEHHHYRSYQGFTCLIQISTRREDFVVDALALRDSLQMLNHTFTNPNILKVFHGADSDIVWLQKDFSVYVVNLFDTFRAASVLDFPQKSLAYLLKHYCDYETDKKYQLEDWRIRPIPEEMLNYARADTHYLLYIYDRMRNELITRSDSTTLNLLRVVLERSAETSLKMYSKLEYSENGEGIGGYKRLQARKNKSFDYQQLAVFKVLHAWRDRIAREEDESTGYVLPNEMLMTLSEKMPDDPKEISSCFKTGVPSFVRMNILELARLIKDARNIKPVPMEMERDYSLLETPFVKDVSKYKSNSSMLFRDYLDEPVAQDDNLKKKALDITSSLSFSLPVPKFINYLNNPNSNSSQSNGSQPPNEVLFTPATQRTTKTQETDLARSSSKGKEREIVNVSNDSKKRRLPEMVEEDVEGVEPTNVEPIIVDVDPRRDDISERNKMNPDNGMARHEVSPSSSSINADVAQNKQASTKKRKRNNKRVKMMKDFGLTQVTGTNGVELGNRRKLVTMVDHTELPQTVTSGLSTSSSTSISVDTSTRNTMRTVETIRQSTNSVQTPFDPYSQTVIDERLRRSDPRLPTAPSSGNRSMTMDNSSNFQRDDNDPNDQDKKCTIM
ncbi:1495_t:CDS:10 [Funneliformis caledonium]|uniref:1495_t:CDS:1 n=1 Tax=Funneliformis caledonium TaxID=1117310 RepID=A0A9N8WNB7_9GLOM|nr:1495_t:CDS:10 [Funneliformis caledonium]